MENLGAIRRSKSAQCKFGSILICIFFYVQNEFPSFGKISWKTNRSIVVQVNEYIEQIGANFETIMTSYFEDFKAQKQLIAQPKGKKTAKPSLAKPTTRESTRATTKEAKKKEKKKATK